MTKHPITIETIFTDLLDYKYIPPVILRNPTVLKEDYINGKFSIQFVLEVAQLAYNKGKQDGGNEND